MSGHWGQLKERGSAAGIKFIVWIGAKLGRNVARIAIYPVAAYFFLFSRNARHASERFLMRAYLYDSENCPIKAKPNWRDSFRHLLNFAFAILDKLLAWLGQITKLDIDFPNESELLELMAARKGGVIFGSHLGNLEVTRAAIHAHGGPRMNVLVHTRHAEKFNSVLNKINPESTLRLIEVSDINPGTAILLRKKIADGEFVVVLADRVPASHSMKLVDAEFLGNTASFPLGPFVLAGLLDCPVYLMFCLKTGQRYCLHFEAFAESLKFDRKNRQRDLADQVQAYARRLEHFSVRYPQQWYNFYDFWKEN